MTLSDREIQHGETMDREVSRFIEHRSRQLRAQEGGRASEWGWMQREREDAEDRAELRRELWRRHHQKMQALHSSLAQQHRQQRERLTSSRTEGT